MVEPFDTIDAYRTFDRCGLREVKHLRALTAQFPRCVELWDFLGDVMQICEEDGYRIADSIECYKKAISIDPDYAIAHESLGFAYDTYFDDFDSASRHFRHALATGGSDSAKLGLARVLAQQGRIENANAILETCTQPRSSDWFTLRDEIANGTWCDTPRGTA